MTRPTLADFPAGIQSQIAAQLYSTPHPRTVCIEPADEPAQTGKKRRKDDSGATSFFVRCGIPAPVVEFRFHATRRWRFDYAWPDARIALEVEGGVWTGGRHTRGAGFIADMEKYNAAALAGWRVFRCVPAKLRTAETVRMIKEAFLKP